MVFYYIRCYLKHYKKRFFARNDAIIKILCTFALIYKPNRGDMETKDKKPRKKPTWTPESAARRAETQFGGPRANPQYHQALASNQRTFYRWVETEASIEELQDYVKDKTKPAIRRKFVKAMLDCKKAQDFFDLTNQTHGMPKQQVEVTELPSITINLED